MKFYYEEGEINLSNHTHEEYRHIKSQKMIFAILGIFFFTVCLFNENLNITGVKLDGTDNTDSSFLPLDYQNLKVSQGELLYYEDFDNGTAYQWITIGGTWSVENKQYKATGVSGERVRSYYSGEVFQNYTYEGDLKLVSGAEIQLIFNVQDISSGVDQGHYCQITLFYDDPGNRKDTAILYTTQNGQTEHIRTSYNFNHNQWYHFKVVSIGSTVAFFLNDSQIFSYSGLLYSSGYIGVKSMFGPTAYWDNIKVSKFNGSSKIQLFGNSGWDIAKNKGLCTGNGTYYDPYIIKDLVIDAGGIGSCITIQNSDVYFRIENCTLYNSQWAHSNAGIRLYNVDNGTLTNNNCSSNFYGIYLSSSDNNTISGNNAKNNKYFGIDLRYSSNNNNITGNTISNNGDDGIHLYQVADNTVKGNEINSNSHGIYTYNCDNITVIGNTIKNNDGDGIHFYRTDNNNVRANIIKNNTGDGIYFYGSYYYDSSYNVVIGNNISSNNYGIVLSGVNNTLLGNRMDGCGLAIDGSLVEMRSHIINSSNLVNDKPLYYYIDTDNLGTDNFTNAGQIFLVSCDNSLIFNLTLSNCSTGISLYYSNYNNISENIANNNIDNGIYLLYSNYNNITGNTANNNSDGIYLYATYGNALSDNRASNNTGHGIYLSNSYGWAYEGNSVTKNEVNHNYYGIYLSYSRYDIITANNVSNNQYGIYLTSSSQNNDVSENNISFNFYGIRLGWGCDSNTIVRNNIMNNYYGIYLYYCKCNTISDNDFSDNTFDIVGTQEECNPLPFGMLLIIVAFIVTIIVIAVVVTGVIAKKRIEIKKSRLPKDEVARYKVLKERERYEPHVRDESRVERKPLAANISRCPYCGTPMNDDWVFCKKCGSRSEKKP